MSSHPSPPADPPVTPPAGTYAPPAFSAAALLPQLADGPVTVTRACTGCVRRGCAPAECEDSQRFLRLVEELQLLEERGLVRLWIHNLYSPRADSRAMARVHLTDAGRAALLVAAPVAAPALASPDDDPAIAGPVVVTPMIVARPAGVPKRTMRELTAVADREQRL